MNKSIVTLSLLGFLVLVGAGCTNATENGSNTELEEALGIPNNEVTEETMVNLSDFTEIPTSFPGVLVEEDRVGKTATIKTEKGDIELELYGEYAPMAVSNFIVLSETGYYDDLTFHRREEGFVIQGGDPNGTGSGGPGYRFEDELGGEYTEYPRGTLAMANAGPATNGSQFFIMLGNTPLPNLYTIFGTVTDGLDVVDEIQVGDSFSTIEIR